MDVKFVLQMLKIKKDSYVNVLMLCNAINALFVKWNSTACRILTHKIVKMLVKGSFFEEIFVEHYLLLIFAKNIA